MTDTTGMTPETIEGRLLAHRRLLGLVLAELSRQGAARAVEDALRDGQVLQDGQEDPGGVPDAALALELASTDEFRAVETVMRRHLPAGPGGAGGPARRSPADRTA